MKAWIRIKVVQPFIDLLCQGITPHKLALTIALGCVLGVIPVLGTTTILCTVAALTLGLNLPAIQLVNGLVYPLQLAMLIPFLKAGAWLFRDGQMSLSLTQVASLIRMNMWHAIVTLWTATMHALVVWLLAGCLTGLMLYVLFVPILRRLGLRTAENAVAG
jgi:uncharacterized protein (DUF2062 family)